MSEWRGSFKSLFWCPVQVLALLNYCRCKQVKSINSWTVTPLLIQASHVNRQSEGEKQEAFFILAVGKEEKRYLIWFEVLRKLHFLCSRYIIYMDFLKKRLSTHPPCPFFCECSETCQNISIFMISGTCCSPEAQHRVLTVKWAVWVCGGGDMQSTPVRTATWCPATVVT